MDDEIAVTEAIACLFFCILFLLQDVSADQREGGVGVCVRL